MTTVVISPHNVVNFPEGGGHFWVYMQYALGLRQLGCDVYWLERLCSTGDPNQDAYRISNLTQRMKQYGLGESLILYQEQDPVNESHAPSDYRNLTETEAKALFRKADLFLNFNYKINPALLACFQHTAVVDIDPGLLQFWISTGQISLPQHDLYFTIGETVGTPQSLFPNCNLPWIYIRPPVCLDVWTPACDKPCETFTTVSSWWGDEWITDGKSVYENNKRVTFMEFAEVASLTDQVLELAIFFGEGDTEDLRLLKQHGWRIRHSIEVSSTPELYQSYIQQSRGEFSCVKPSCIKFQNAWISDRTLCYLASGKPVVLQDTGPSAFLPNGEGMFRFSTLSEAVEALAKINAHYDQHFQAARNIAETYFDAKQTLTHLLNTALR